MHAYAIRAQERLHLIPHDSVGSSVFDRAGAGRGGGLCADGWLRGAGGTSSTMLHEYALVRERDLYHP